MTHSSAPSSSAGSPTSTLSTSGSGSPYLSGSKTTSSSGPTASVKPSKDTAWFPVEKVRGVNLGSLFIFEPWMARTSWEKLGCSAYDSEWPCIEALGLDTLQPKFEEHWSSFYNETDFTEMARLGLNTVRIPLGYWTVDSLIQEGEYLPRNQMGYLKQVLGWAKSAGIYVILDLHGAPGSQTKDQSFTGHGVEEAGFFTDTNYQRAYDCLTNWTTMAHTDEYFSTVVAIHVVNEPLQDPSTNLTSVYYPGSQKAIRDAEVALNEALLTTSFTAVMDEAWGSGDPTKSIDTTDRVAYDDHNYAQWIVAENSRTRYGYLSYLCTNTRSTDMAPVIVGEWSLSTIGGGELETNSTGAKEFFQQFAAAQIWAAEKGAGQVFWSWKTELGSSTWGYYLEAAWHAASSCYAAPLARKTPASPPAEKVKMAERALDGTKATAWIPVDKVRGVNLGGLFIAEPLGCTGYDDEWTCNEANGLDVMQPRWEKHWSTFYSMRDFNLMKRFGLNTVRIPLGYWSVDALVGSKDYFAKGKMKYVKQVVKWAKQAGLYVILDLHGAPGSQTVAQSFTGHTVPYAKFFTSHNYNRAYEALKNWTIAAHTDPDFSTGKPALLPSFLRVIQVVNEPLQDSSTDVTRVFYPGAQQAIRAAEASLGVSCSGSNASCLTIQFMDDWWGSGHPSSYIDTSDRVAYDDHNYAQWIVPESQRTREGYLRYVCTNSRPTDMYPLITGEWSLSTIGGGELDEGSEGSTQFFRDFFAASVVAAEKGAGQIFWSWKTELQSNLWGYYDGVRAGYIPARMQNVNTSACDPYL
ncbi:hypothetical protein JCM10213v2_005788 [Rhodosporidiobolus nylandii]